MEYFEITGGTPLHGSITLQGSKNAALPLMAASILHPGRTTLHHVPALRDVDAMKYWRISAVRYRKTTGR